MPKPTVSRMHNSTMAPEPEQLPKHIQHKIEIVVIGCFGGGRGKAFWGCVPSRPARAIAHGLSPSAAADGKMEVIYVAIGSHLSYMILIHRGAGVPPIHMLAASAREQERIQTGETSSAGSKRQHSERAADFQEQRSENVQGGGLRCPGELQPEVIQQFRWRCFFERVGA